MCYIAIGVSKKVSSQLPVPPLNDDDVLADDQHVEIPEWHREMLDEALARYNEFGIEGTSWEEFEKELDELIEQELKNRTQGN